MMRTLFQSLVLCLVTTNAQDGPIKELINGRIRGAVETTESGKVYEKYFGIPYATPPLGELRFTKPIPSPPWQGILETVSFANGCMEPANNTNTSEDCLYLNVYVPGQNRSGDNLAVMFFIHGGGYFIGTASSYPGEDLAVHGDLIVVTINYRLGTLGFFSTENEAAPGNYGLWDVKLALEWVRDNIAAFGGSPDRVTVFGQSAGGSLTSHVILSSQTQDLLQRGICISGASSNLGFGTAYAGALSKASTFVGERMGCPIVNDSYALVECLREQDAADINFWGLWSSIDPDTETTFYMPVVDGEFIPQHPLIAWNETLLGGLDLMAGFVIHDAASYVLVQPQDNPNITRNLAQTISSTNRLLGLQFDHYPGDDEEVIAAVTDQYPEINDSDTDIRTRRTADMMTDFLFASGPHYEASQHSLTSGATYLYEYAYTISFMKPYIQEEYDWLIAEHGEDLWSVFGEQLIKEYVTDVLNGEFNEDDKTMSSHVMSYYTNFANTGNPNEGLAVPVEWPQYSREFKEFLQFSEDTKVLVETEDKLENYMFWNTHFPSVAFPDGKPY